MNCLDKAIEIASKAHAGQIDKAGEPYILHPLRLMSKFNSTEEMIVAVLHDVVEDSEVTLQDLKGYGFSEDVITAIDCFSKRKSESYKDFIARISSSNLARNIKIEDIKDNLDVTRLGCLSEKDLARIKKYHEALTFLKEKSKK